MNRKHYILGTLALLCLLGTGYYAWTLYDAHRKQVAEWSEGAKAAFEEALWMEVDKRAETSIFHYSSGENGMTTLREKIPDSVFVMTVNGWQKYKIDRHKYDNSLIKENRKRGHLGALLEMYPLSIDTLLIQWDSLLADRQVPGRSLIRYIYTDWELRDDTICVPVDERMVRSDSLTTRYLGFRCEHEFVAYTSYSFWKSDFLSLAVCWLMLPWMVWGLLFFFYAPLEKFLQKILVRKEVVEREIHVADVSIEKAKIYQLPDGSLFDSFAGTLMKEGLTKQLPPQSLILLRLFLSKENHRLSSFEIEQELWSGRGSAEKLRQAIQRLRRDLKAVSSDVFIKNVNGDYELKLPISSKDLAVMDA